MALRTDLVRGRDSISPRGGLIRATRRPAGWTAPGPQPHPPDDRADIWPDADEDLCWLAGDWRLLQRTEGHRFSLDDLVTAHFAATVATDFSIATGTESFPARILDLGCGIGTVLLLMAWRFPGARVWGIEAQAVSAALARRSITWNGVDDRCGVVSGDLRDTALLEGQPPFDLITGTPPYFPRGTGLESDQIQRGPCRFEHRGGIEDYAAAAALRLAPGAAFVACAAATQTDRVIAAAADTGLVVERRRDIVPRAGKAPLLIVFSMRRQGEAGPARVESPLTVRDATGRRTDEFVALRTDMGMPP
jgi:tRNA1Val (adenine37-N6)-methyltransferase